MRKMINAIRRIESGLSTDASARRTGFLPLYSLTNLYFQTLSESFLEDIIFFENTPGYTEDLLNHDLGCLT